jgi:hypothetical protein
VVESMPLPGSTAQVSLIVICGRANIPALAIQEASRRKETISVAAEDKLRDEVLALQASHRDLLKWKLLVVGSIFAIGFGFAGTVQEMSPMVLCAAPLVCSYCDLLCRDYDVRIGLIATFLRDHDAQYSLYERFLARREIAATRYWRFRKYGIIGASVFVDLTVFVYSVILGLNPGPSRDFTWLLLAISAVVGAILSCSIQRAYSRLHQHLREAGGKDPK